MKKSIMCALSALAGCGVLTAALPADAADCNTLGNKNPVYIAGSTASKPIWAALAKTVPGVDLIYQAPSSCVGLQDVVSAVADTKSAIYEDGSAAGVTCTNPGPVNIGISDVFPTSCGSLTVPSGFKDFFGPIQAMVMAVPYASTESSISADAAYAVFGWGGTMYQVAPWTDYTKIFIRAPTSGNETMIGAAIGLASSKWLSQVPDAGASQQEASATAVLQALQAAGAATPSTAIGILSSDIGDTNRGVAGTNDAGTPVGGIKLLAFKAADQSCGYLPDSDATHFDKINVRQGRYDIWGPLHLLTAVDGSNNPTSAAAASVIKYLGLDSSLSVADQTTVITADANAFVIPQCAMQVSRAAEVSPVTGGGMASYQPPAGCGCFYETLKNGGSPYSKYCKSCSADTDCAATPSYSKCHFGYCEAQ
jgi:hypothetical protein